MVYLQSDRRFGQKTHGDAAGTNIMEQGTVSGCVLDLSRLLGCQKVLLVGQDMSVRDDGRYYTDDSSYADSGAHYSNSPKGQRLPGNTQDKVLVEQRLFVYLKTFEQFIAKKEPNIEYRNLARTGVKIQGAPYLNYDQASEWIGSTSNTAFCERLRHLLDQQGQCPDLKEVFSRAKVALSNFWKKRSRPRFKPKCFRPSWKGPTSQAINQSRAFLKKEAKSMATADSSKEFWNLLLEGRTKSELVVYQRIIRDMTSPTRIGVQSRETRNIFGL